MPNPEPTDPSPARRQRQHLARVLHVAAQCDLAPSRRRVLDVLCGVSARASQLPFSHSQRSIAERAGLTRETVALALHDLERHGFIARFGIVPGGSTLFAVCLPPFAAFVDLDHAGDALGALRMRTALYSADALRHAGIGLAAGRLLAEIAAATEPPSVADLAARLHRKEPAIRKQLRKLAEHDLARRVAGRWRLAPGALDRLDAVAADVGSAGVAARQQRRHAEERIAHNLNQSRRRKAQS